MVRRGSRGSPDVAVSATRLGALRREIRGGSVLPSKPATAGLLRADDVLPRHHPTRRTARVNVVWRLYELGGRRIAIHWLLSLCRAGGSGTRAFLRVVVCRSDHRFTSVFAARQSRPGCTPAR